MNGLRCALVLLLALGGAGSTRAEIHEERLTSAALGRDLAHVVYTPPSADRPVATIYLLHGTNARGRDWVTMAKAAETLDRLILGGRLRPVVAVMPDAANSWYVDSGLLGGPGDHQRALLDELVPAIDRRWRTDARRGARAIAGISMGGYGALRFAFARPDLFAAAASMSGAFWLATDQRTRPPEVIKRIFDGAFGDPFDRERFERLAPWGEASRLAPDAAPAIFFIAGRHERFRSLEESQALAARLAAQGFRTEATDVDGDHDWGTWERSLEPVLLFIERAFAARR